jgi:uridine kinase
VICSELGIKETRTLIEKSMINCFFDEVIYAKTPAIIKSKISIATRPDEFSVVVCESEMFVDAAFQSGVASIRTIEQENQTKGRETLTVDTIDLADEAVMQAEVFFKIVKTFCVDQKCRLIGIDGIELVGKTYFSRKLMNFLALRGIKSMTVRLCDFRNPVVESYRGEDEVEAYYFHAYNCNKFIDEILQPFTNDGCLDVTVYSFEGDANRHGHELEYHLDRDGVLLVEGEHMYREPLIDFFDGKIYLFMDELEALHRALVRDIYLGDEERSDEYKRKHIPAQKMYSVGHLPIDKSDFAIDNTNYRRPKIVVDDDIF